MKATEHHRRHRPCPSCTLVGLGKVYVPTTDDCGKVLLLQCTPTVVRRRRMSRDARWCRQTATKVSGHCWWTLCGAGYFSRTAAAGSRTGTSPPNADAHTPPGDSARGPRRPAANPSKNASPRAMTRWTYRGVVAIDELGLLLHRRRKDLAVAQARWPPAPPPLCRRCCSRPTDDNGFRVASYNILAQGLVFRFASDPQITAFPAALDEAYRWTLLFDQIRGLQADIVCLQEVGARTWRKLVRPPAPPSSRTHLSSQ